MKINTVGFGTTNGILVDRGWMGTELRLTLLVLQLPKLMVRILLIIISISTPHHEAVPIGSITNSDERLDWYHNSL